MAATFSLADDLELALDPSAILSHAGIEPQSWQREILRDWRRDRLLCCCRHSGKSTAGAAMALHAALNYPGHPVVVVGRASRQSVETFRKARELYTTLPNKPRLTIDSVTMLEMENRSRILALPGSEETVRGISGASAIVLDEAAWVGEDLLVALEPMLSTTGGPLWIMSSPFGKRGFFYEYWRDPESGFEKTKVMVDQCPHISQEFVEKRRQRWPQWKFRQEFFCEFADTDETVFGTDLVRSAINPEVQPLWA